MLKIDTTLKILGANRTRVTLSGGREVWFSYGAPIAVRPTAGAQVFTCDADDDDETYSTTTRRHRGMLEREHAAVRVQPSEFAILLASL